MSETLARQEVPDRCDACGKKADVLHPVSTCYPDDTDGRHKLRRSRECPQCAFPGIKPERIPEISNVITGSRSNAAPVEVLKGDLPNEPKVYPNLYDHPDYEEALERVKKKMDCGQFLYANYFTGETMPDPNDELDECIERAVWYEMRIINVILDDLFIWWPIEMKTVRRSLYKNPEAREVYWNAVNWTYQLRKSIKHGFSGIEIRQGEWDHIMCLGVDHLSEAWMEWWNRLDQTCTATMNYCPN